MKNNKRSILFTEIIGALLILLFVYAGMSKLLEGERFRAVLAQSPLIGSKARFLSLTLPITELVIAFLLLIPATRTWGLIISLVLMSVFTLYIGCMIVFTPHLPCSCGGVISNMGWGEHLVFNIFFTALAAAGLWLYHRNEKESFYYNKQG